MGVYPARMGMVFFLACSGPSENPRPSSPPAAHNLRRALLPRRCTLPGTRVDRMEFLCPESNRGTYHKECLKANINFICIRFPLFSY